MKKQILHFVFLLGCIFAQAQTEFKLEQNELILPSAIVFEPGSDQLKLAESKASLEHIKAFLEAKSYISLIRIESHSDNNGSESANQTLTEKRAASVYNWLKEHGVDCKRMIAVGFGATKPKADNSTVEGKAQNRRVSIYMAELRNRAIGGMPVDGGGKVSATCR